LQGTGSVPFRKTIKIKVASPMKKIKKTWLIAFALCALFIFGIPAVLAEAGDIGFFGGISEGTRLPLSTDILIQNGKKITNRTLTNLTYKEIVFLDGVPKEVSGLLTVKQQGDIADTATYGSYKVTYTVARAPGATTNFIQRSIVFNVTWRREGTQVVKNYVATSWTETINVEGTTFTLSTADYSFTVSLLEDNTPGVVYTRGDMSVKATYTNGATRYSYTGIGEIYGFSSAWANTETHRLNGRIETDEWQMSYQVRPSVSVLKTLQYSKSEPTLISFDGNYKEVSYNESGLAYTIFNIPAKFTGMADSGFANITTPNTFEQLPFVNVSEYAGHPSARDIEKLFAMGMATGPVNQYKPNQAIRRGDFVTMLVKAIKLPIEKPSTKKPAKNAPVVFTFPDVLPERADYPYIMAAYKAGIAGGRGLGQFYPDHALQRDEAIFMIVRAMGLSGLGLTPTNATPFADDADIADWAKKELYAAAQIGIIVPDANGNVNPKTTVSKGEAAAIINGFIEYMRIELKADYAEHIVGYVY